MLELYLLSFPRTVEIRAGEPTIVDFRNDPYGNLTIKKVDAADSRPLAKASFQVTTIDGTVIGTYETSEDGTVTIPSLVPDKAYKISEITPPPGYKIDEAAKEIIIKSGETAVVTFKDSKLTGLQILKKDSVTGLPLAGCTFRVEKLSGERLGDFVTDDAGQILISEIAPTWLKVYETACPDGYILNPEPQLVEIKTGTPATLYFKNTPIKGLTIIKQDNESKKPLAGALFLIERMDGSKIGEFESDDQGKVFLDLEPGDYVITEVRSPSGYVISTASKKITMKPGEANMVTFYNSAEPILQIQKTTKDGKPVANVTFKVTKESGEFVSEATTGLDGLATLTVKPGFYLVSEVSGPDNIIINPIPKLVEVKVGAPTRVQFINDEIAGIRIQKTVKQTGAPLKGVRFSIQKDNGEMIGNNYVTDAAGIIYVELEPGTYIITELSAPEGYEVDSQPRTVVVKANEPTVVYYEDAQLSGIRIRKVDAATGRGISGVRILIKDEDKHIIGEYETDQKGYIELEDSLPDGIYYLEEIEAAPGYDLDTQIKKVKLERGKTKEIRWENAKTEGQIQIIKRSLDDNPYNNKPAESLLEGAVFEISREDTGKVVCYATSDYRGVAASKVLPIGKYVVREVEAPKYYQLNPKEFIVQLKTANDIVKIEVYDKSLQLGTTIKKTGNQQVQGGSQMRYDFTDICNTSNVPLENFYWHDSIPTNAVTLNAIYTGTWNENLTYRVVYRTNRNSAWRTLADGLFTTQGYDLDCSAARMGFARDEYITEFRFEFGKVKAGFREVNKPKILVTVSGRLPNGYQFNNRADAGGQYQGKWFTSSSNWITTVIQQDKIKYPQTGY